MQNTNGKTLRFVFDLDNTICLTEGTNYAEAKPIQKQIDMINDLYNQGYHIIIFTARGTKTKIDWSEITSRQLKDWGVNYHELLFGKPYADYYIDDKNLSLREMEKKYETSWRNRN